MHLEVHLEFMDQAAPTLSHFRDYTRDFVLVTNHHGTAKYGKSTADDDQIVLSHQHMFLPATGPVLKFNGTLPKCTASDPH